MHVSASKYNVVLILHIHNAFHGNNIIAWKINIHNQLSVSCEL